MESLDRAGAGGGGWQDLRGTKKRQVIGNMWDARSGRCYGCPMKFVASWRNEWGRTTRAPHLRTENPKMGVNFKFVSVIAMTPVQSAL